MNLTVGVIVSGKVWNWLTIIIMKQPMQTQWAQQRPLSSVWIKRAWIKQTTLFAQINTSRLHSTYIYIVVL